jgi:hypothetical protein
VGKTLFRDILEGRRWRICTNVGLLTRFAAVPCLAVCYLLVPGIGNIDPLRDY